ncbi:MAG: NapC/NirT family cytochrome c [Anaerolineae bacterium]|nr:NapC/NirT family cytochrome c [Anaerolineae bacterium]
MKRIFAKLKKFFFPPPGTSASMRILPYGLLGLLTLAAISGGVYTWEYTNSPEFCGTTCHTMPPEFSTYLTSPHARVDCVECHIGRDFLATRVSRKFGDIRHVTATLFQTYEFPIRAHRLRPARETCEQCHFPEKFSDDSLRQISRFEPDDESTARVIYLLMKTGGGVEREGLGYGIHWHIQREVYYLPSNDLETEIPFVRVVNPDGSSEDYIDIEANLDSSEINPEDLKQMDCITCHNRITHNIAMPDQRVDDLLARGIISVEIPEIRRKAVEALEGPYDTLEAAMQGIEGLLAYYEDAHRAYYYNNREELGAAVKILQKIYAESVFPEQKQDWNTHTNNIGHQSTPGCFRCHDGKHLNAEEAAVRLECNLCHSIPVVVDEGDIVAEIEISRGVEPESHLNANWIALHRDVFDSTCENCHSVGNPGGTDNTSFCSNSACHGSVWTYAGFDAPALHQLLLAQIPSLVEDEEPTASHDQSLTYNGIIGALFAKQCTTCHGADSVQGLDLRTYTGTMNGGDSGPMIVSGDPLASLLVQVHSGEETHYVNFSTQELVWVIEWIFNGAPEK